MNTRVFSAYNLARGVLLNSKLTAAESGNQPLKLLDIVVSGMGMDPTAGLWLAPLHAIPAVPRVFPFDLIYLDKEYHVLDTAEMGPGIDFPAFHAEVASALILPSDTLRRTHTEPADRLIVCVSNELTSLLAATPVVPSIDSAAPNREYAAVATALSSAGKTSEPSVIKLTPEPQPVAPAAPVTPFEQSILSAVAKVAETRHSSDPHAPTDARRAAVQGPSMAITDAVLDSPHRVQPTIMEHHIDPEDLFSNWVVSAPPALSPSRTGRTGPPAPPVSAKSQMPEPVNQNGKRSSDYAKTPSPKDSQPVRVKEREAQALSVQAKVKGVPGAANRPALSTKGKTESEVKTPPRQDPGRFQSVPATTFTSAPYGMWQVSMPTAIAPMSGAKSPEPMKPAPSNKKNGTAQPKSVVAAPPKTTAPPPSPEPADSPIPPATRPALPSTASKPQTGVGSASVESVLKADRAPTVRKPRLGDQANAEVHTPGDFVASLQEKLERAQHSRPASAPAAEAAPEKMVASAAVPSATVHQPERSGILPSPAKASSPAVAGAGGLSSTKPAAGPILNSKSKSSPIPEKAKTESSGSLRSRFKHWLNPGSSPSDRRGTTRRYVPGMVAHYFTGGAPKPNNVADISMSGMYLLTDDRWMPGTIIQMTLQKPCAHGERKQSINVLSRIIRRGSDGVAAEFVMSEALSHISHDIQASQATDRMALARFL